MVDEQTRQARGIAMRELGRPLELITELRDIRAELDDIEHDLQGVDYGERIGGRSADQTSRTERAAIRAEKVCERLREVYSEWADADDRAVEIIRRVYQWDARSALHLTWHYLSGYSMRQLEDMTGYSGEYLRQLKNRGLDLAYLAIRDMDG